MRDKPVLLSIVFSFRNEQDTLLELIRRVRLVCLSLKEKHQLSDYELIFVNDASSDNSASLLMGQIVLGAKDIRLINMSRTFGVAPCVLAGFKETRGDVVIYMDADLQDPPELIPQLLAAWKEDPSVDVVHTQRRNRQGENFLKLWITAIGYRILNRYSNTSIPINAGDFKLLSRRVVDQLIEFKEFNPFIRGLISWVGFKQIFISYDRHPRFAGKSKFFVLSKKVVSNFLTSALINFSSVPLQIASYIGLVALLIDFVFIGHVIIQKVTGQAIPGWTALMTVILFLGGVQLFSIGTIGLYLHSVHQQTKMRPTYIITSRHGFKESA